MAKALGIFFGIVLLIAVLAAAFFAWYSPGPTVAATSFEECAALGNPVMESYPRQCIDAAGNHFVEDISDTEQPVPQPEPEPEESTLEIAGSGDYVDKIRVASPAVGEVISSPLIITGDARGPWYFEATFSVVLVDWDGRIIAETYAEATDDWMTTEYVPFTSTVTFEKPYPDTIEPQEFMKRGWLILKKANASGLPEHDAAIEIPIRFES